MENTGNISTSRILVNKLDILGYTLIKEDGSEFSDSEVDKIFRKTFEHSEHGAEYVERFGSTLVVRVKEPEEARSFIKDLAFNGKCIDIMNNLNMISSEHHDTWVKIELAKRDGQNFTTLEIDCIFWNVFKYPSASTFMTSAHDKKITIYFKEIKEYNQFIKQLLGENAKCKNNEANKTENKKRFGNLNKFFEWVATELS